MRLQFAIRQAMVYPPSLFDTVNLEEAIRATELADARQLPIDHRINGDLR